VQLRDSFPVDACAGGDFVTGRYEVAPGEHVVDLDRDLDALPSWGRLCLHEDTVRLLMTCLGWDYDAGVNDKLKETRAELARVRAVNKKLNHAIVAVIEAATEAGVQLQELVDAS
jgi:hypothetical protein